MDRRPQDEIPEEKLSRTLGFGSATLLVVGNVIGSALFLTTGIMARDLPSVSLLLAAWVVGGLISLAGGLTCAELGTMFPRSGGWYVFLREAYGPIWGFLFAWSGLVVLLTGSVAAVAVGFAEYLAYFFPPLGMDRILLALPLPWGDFRISAGQVTAAVSILALGAVNYVGVRSGNALQAGLTLAKVLAIAIIPLVALAYRRVMPEFAPLAGDIGRPAASFGVAMIPVLWAYSGWDYLSFAAGEIKHPGRNIPRALIYGIALLMGLYLAVNAAYMFSLRIDEMRGVVRIAERSMQALVGPAGAALVSGLVLVSTLGCNASSIIPISRVCYAMAADGLFFKSAAAVHEKYRTPHIAIVMSCGWAALLTLTGTYEQLYTYVVFTALLFNVAGGMAVFKLRRSRPEMSRPYRTWGYPILPAIFVLSTLVLVVSTFLERPVESIAGTGLVALGLPAYRHWTRSKTRHAAQ